MKIDNKVYSAAVNIGIRPMFEVSAPLLEAHIFDFDGNLYDQIIDVIPFQNIRSELKFESIKQLKQQIDSDCLKIKAILK